MPIDNAAGTGHRDDGSRTALTTEDELEIRALVARYHDAVSRADAATWAATWATDGQWHLGKQSVVGRAAIVERWKQIMAPYEFGVVQLAVPQLVRATPGGAEGQSTFLEIARKAGEDSDHVEVGCYADRYVRQAGRWVFAERRFTLAYRGAIAAGTFFPRPPAA
jgi:ketosteroid isomerase-like protein